MKIRVYHRTTVEGIEGIRRRGFTSQENTNELFVSTARSGQNVGYGDRVVILDVPENLLRLDDEFPDGEQHYALSLAGRDARTFVVEYA